LWGLIDFADNGIVAVSTKTREQRFTISKSNPRRPALTIAQFLDFTGLFFGLASGGAFSYGVLTIKSESLRVIAGAFYDGGQQQVAELGQQKADFRYGAGFLVVSFFLQLLAKLEPIMPTTQLLNFWLCLLASASVVVIAVVACVPSWRRARSAAVTDAAQMNQ
jgi:hypothetical protein